MKEMEERNIMANIAQIHLDKFLSIIVSAFGRLIMSIFPNGTERGDYAKMRNLILYVLHKSKDDPRCGATKLNKLLFFIEFRYFATYLQTITKYKYRKIDRGPAPRELEFIRGKMIGEGDCKLVETKYHNKNQKRLIPLKPFDKSTLTNEEMKHTDKIIQKYWEYNARTITDEAYKLLGVQVAEKDEIIPPEIIFVTNRPLTQKEIDYGRSLIP